jgi:hypothetical protein
MSKHEVEKLIGMVSTTEWGPLPLDEVAVVTGGSSKGAGNSFRGWLGISGSRGFGKRPKAGLTFLHNAYGQRFARSYQYHPNGSRYYWRRFPQSTSDGSIVEDAVRRFGVAFMVNGEPKSAQPSLLKLVPVTKPEGLDSLSDADLLRRADQAQRELDALTSLRNKRIDMLQEQIDRLRGGPALADTSSAHGLAKGGR